MRSRRSSDKEAFKKWRQQRPFLAPMEVLAEAWFIWGPKVANWMSSEMGPEGEKKATLDTLLGRGGGRGGGAAAKREAARNRAAARADKVEADNAEIKSEAVARGKLIRQAEAVARGKLIRQAEAAALAKLKAKRRPRPAVSPSPSPSPSPSYSFSSDQGEGTLLDTGHPPQERQPPPRSRTEPLGLLERVRSAWDTAISLQHLEITDHPAGRPDLRRGGLASPTSKKQKDRANRVAQEYKNSKRTRKGIIQKKEMMTNGRKKRTKR